MANSENKEANDTDPRILKIAKKLKELRISKGYSSHEAFAWDNNLNRVQYWRIEKGSNLTLRTILNILDIHQISPSEFFKDIDWVLLLVTGIKIKKQICHHPAQLGSIIPSSRKLIFCQAHTPFISLIIKYTKSVEVYGYGSPSSMK